MTDRIVVPPRDAARLAEVGDAIAAGGNPVLLFGDGKSLPCPPELTEALLTIAETLQTGQGAAIVPVDTMVTVEDAAELLRRSRHEVVKLLSDGDLPYQKRDGRRLISLADLVVFHRDTLTAYRRHVSALLEDDPPGPPSEP